MQHFDTYASLCKKYSAVSLMGSLIAHRSNPDFWQRSLESLKPVSCMQFWWESILIIPDDNEQFLDRYKL